MRAVLRGLRCNALLDVVQAHTQYAFHFMQEWLAFLFAGLLLVLPVESYLLPIPQSILRHIAYTPKPQPHRAPNGSPFDQYGMEPYRVPFCLCNESNSFRFPLAGIILPFAFIWKVGCDYCQELRLW